MGSGRLGGIDRHPWPRHGHDRVPRPAVSISKSPRSWSTSTATACSTRATPCGTRQRFETPARSPRPTSCVIDTPDTYANYVPNSTTGGGVAIPDDTSPDTPFPSTTAGFLGPVVQPARRISSVRHGRRCRHRSEPDRVHQHDPHDDLGGHGIASTLLPIKYPSLAIRKFHDDADGIVDPGQVVTFTVEVTNTDLLTQNDFNVSDIVPLDSPTCPRAPWPSVRLEPRQLTPSATSSASKTMETTTELDSVVGRLGRDQRG